MRFFQLFLAVDLNLEQHLAPSLAEIIGISFGLGSTHVRPVGLDGHCGAAQRNGGNGNAMGGRSSAATTAGRRRRRCGGISKATERRHRLSGAAQSRRRMANAAGQRLLAVAGSRSAAAAHAHPAAGAELVHPPVISTSLNLQLRQTKFFRKIPEEENFHSKMNKMLLLPRFRACGRSCTAGRGRCTPWGQRDSPGLLMR